MTDLRRPWAIKNGEGLPLEHFQNKVYCIDNLKLLCKLPSESVDLVYIDPPFFTQRSFKNKDGIGFDDKFESMAHYVGWMKVRVIEIHRILKDTGSIFLHCDWRVSHHLRFLLDEVFGEKNFSNEIVWKYGLGGSAKKCFSRKHDAIFFYSKSSKFKFEKLQEVATSAMLKGKMKGMIDVWDIPSVNNMAKERLGYPTQKPEALLERIVKACSNEGDIVADFFCGSGTTLAVAKKLKRRYIGCDSNPDAVKITKERLDAIPE